MTPTKIRIVALTLREAGKYTKVLEERIEKIKEGGEITLIPTPLLEISDINWEAEGKTVVVVFIKNPPQGYKEIIERCGTTLINEFGIPFHSLFGDEFRAGAALWNWLYNYIIFRNKH